METSYIPIGREGTKTGTPAGPIILSLMNILLMFPLGGGTENSKLEFQNHRNGSSGLREESAACRWCETKVLLALTFEKQQDSPAKRPAFR